MKLLTIFILPAVLFMVFLSCKNSDEDIKLLELEPCLALENTQNLRLITWNLNQFPKTKSSISEVARIIEKSHADLFAFQEIDDEDILRELVKGQKNLQLTALSQGERKLGFIYNKEVFQLSEGPFEFIKASKKHFPRPPLVIVLSRRNQKKLVVINLHLKAFDGQENLERRKASMLLLKNYIDSNFAQDQVIVMGDFNAELSDRGISNIFIPFKNDSLNFRIIDRVRKNERFQDYSYPNYPSHLDHIIISNELFSANEEVKVLALAYCDSDYLQLVSDHQPVSFELSPTSSQE